MQTDGNIVLAGFMGTGKTTVGRLIAEKLAREFVDADDMIQKQAQMAIPQIFAQYGEARFREIETDIARQLAARAGLVIATGGGMVVSPINVELLQRTGTICCLTATPQQIYARLLVDNESIPRPLLDGPNPRARIEELLAARADVYAQFPQVCTDYKSPNEIADEICTLLELQG